MRSKRNQNQDKKIDAYQRLFQCGAPGRIRTHDPLVRSQVLYPTELRALKKQKYSTVKKKRLLAANDGFDPAVVKRNHRDALTRVA